MLSTTTCSCWGYIILDLITLHGIGSETFGFGAIYSLYQQHCVTVTKLYADDTVLCFTDSVCLVYNIAGYS